MTAIILVRPQLGENIGMAARAMLNCSQKQLRLVAPRDGWPNPAAFPAAAGADEILEKARVFESVEEAISDLHYVAATTARSRYMEKPVTSLFDWDPFSSVTWGVLFGSEASGLSNAEIQLADHLLTIPTNPSFSSLNLAQAVYAVCLILMKNSQKPSEPNKTPTPPAPKKELTYFLKTLETTLEEKGFFSPSHKKPLMQQNLRTIFVKGQLTSQEVRTLHGVLRTLQK